jgi:hypothetical protein
MIGIVVGVAIHSNREQKRENYTKHLKHHNDNQWQLILYKPIWLKTENRGMSVEILTHLSPDHRSNSQHYCWIASNSGETRPLNPNKKAPSRRNHTHHYSHIPAHALNLYSKK